MIPNQSQLQNAVKPLMEKFLTDLHSHGYFKDGCGDKISSAADKLVDVISRQNVYGIKSTLCEIIHEEFFSDPDSAPSLCLQFLTMTMQNGSDPANISIAFMAEIKTLKTKYDMALRKTPTIQINTTQSMESDRKEFSDNTSYGKKLLFLWLCGVLVAGGLIRLALQRKRQQTCTTVCTGHNFAEITPSELAHLKSEYGMKGKRTVVCCYFNEKQNCHIHGDVDVKSMNVSSDLEHIQEFKAEHNITKDCFACFDPADKTTVILSSPQEVKQWLQKAHNTALSFGENDITDSTQLSNIVKNIKKPIVIFLHLENCGPCLAFGDKYMELANRYRNHMSFYAIKCDRHTQMGGYARAFEITLFPTVLILLPKANKSVGKCTDEWSVLFNQYAQVFKLVGTNKVNSLERALGKLLQQKKKAA